MPKSLKKAFFSLNLFVLFLLCGTFATTSFAATYTVTKTADTNDGVCNADCSLREAAAAANASVGADTIVFAPALNNQIILLTTGEIVITDDLTVDNPGTSVITISGNNNSRIFSMLGTPPVPPSTPAIPISVTINGIIFTDGNGMGSNTGSDGIGGALLAADANLVLSRSTIRSSTATNDGGGINIYRAGPHRIIDSTINDNTVSNTVPGSGICGGLSVDSATLYLLNSTITKNTVTNGGDAGGVCNQNTEGTSGPIMKIRNSTITMNTANGDFGGIYNATSAALDIANTIVAGNTANTAPDIFNDPNTTAPSTLTSLGSNIFGTLINSNVAQQSSDIVTQTINVGALGNYGGPTQTIRLFANSPAINAGDNTLAVDPGTGAALANDQRGPGFNRIITGRVDIGAFEFAPPTAADVSVSGQTLLAPARRLSYVYVHLTSVTTGETITAVSNSRSTFRFRAVKSGEMYILSVTNTRFNFVPQLITVDGEIQNLQVVLTR